MDRAFAYSKTSNMQTYLEVAESNTKAIDFYKKNGFKKQEKEDITRLERKK